jgi:threonine dehydrogenase-like Zn-dependent dehydrogenase
MEAAYGYSGSGLFGYSHMMSGYAGGQAHYVRVPFANVGPLKVESDLPDEKVAMYEIWRDKKERVTKIVIDPWAGRAA